MPTPPPLPHDSLHFAVIENDLDAVRALLAAGRDPNARDRGGRVALSYALQPDDAQAQAIFDALLAVGTDVATADANGDTLLHDALCWLDSAEHVDNVRRLVDAGAPIEARNARGETPLHVACQASWAPWSHAAVKLLLERGADFRTRDDEGSSPLHYLACWGHDAGARLLLDAGLDPDVVEPDIGYTALHYACVGGHYDVAALLLGRGARTNVTTADGRTPLMGAAEYGSPWLVRALLDRGADPDTRDGDGRTALDRVQALVGDTGLETALVARASAWEVESDAPVRRIRWQSGRDEPVLSVERGGTSVEHMDAHTEVMRLLRSGVR